MSLYLVVMVTFNFISLEPLLAFVHRPLGLKFFESLPQPGEKRAGPSTGTPCCELLGYARMSETRFLDIAGCAPKGLVDSDSTP